MIDSPDSPDADFAKARLVRQLASGALVVVLLLITFLWIESYAAGRSHYRSTWSGNGTETSERARWLISNFGSFGYAWRRQTGIMGHGPENARKVKRFAASKRELSHVHPPGFASWHWFSIQSPSPTASGPVTHRYGHVFVPYWAPFGILFFVLILLNLRKET